MSPKVHSFVNDSEKQTHHHHYHQPFLDTLIDIDFLYFSPTCPVLHFFQPVTSLCRLVSALVVFSGYVVYLFSFQLEGSCYDFFVYYFVLYGTPSIILSSPLWSLLVSRHCKSLGNTHWSNTLLFDLILLVSKRSIHCPPRFSLTPQLFDSYPRYYF